MFFLRLAFIALVYIGIKFIYELFGKLKLSSKTRTRPNIHSKKNSIYTDIKDAEFEDIK